MRAPLARLDRLTPYDRASLERAIAYMRSDSEGAYQASPRLVKIAPGSADAAYLLALDATNTNRFAEAIQTLHRVGPNRGWLLDGHEFARIHSRGHHWSGDFATELAEAQQIHRAGQENHEECAYRVRPRAALGQEAAVDSVITECLQYPGAPGAGVAYLAAGNE